MKPAQRRQRLAALRRSHVPATSSLTKAALWRMEASFAAPKMPLICRNTLPAMFASVFVIVAVPYDQGLLLGDPLVENTVRCIRVRTPHLPVGACLECVIPFDKTGTGRKIPTGEQVDCTAASAIALPQAVTHPSLAAIAAMTEVLSQDTFPSKQKRRMHLGAYSLRGIVLMLSNAFSSMAKKEEIMSFDHTRLFDLIRSVHLRSEYASRSSGLKAEFSSS